MKVITEAKVRAEVPRSEQPEMYYVRPGYILSPAAREYLMGRQIKISNEPQQASVTPQAVAAPAPSDNDGKTEASYVDYESGACYFEKPVHMTVLYDNVLVCKDHPQILFRGKAENLEADMMLLLAQLADTEETGLLQDLQAALALLRAVLRGHCLNQPLDVDAVLGLTPAALREALKKRLKEPTHYRAADGDVVYAQLNQLYARTREVESAAVTALREGNHYSRTDILEALNSLSSALRIIMLKHLAGEYTK